MKEYKISLAGDLGSGKSTVGEILTEKYGLENKQIVSVKASGTGRETIFGDVVVRVSDKFALAMHIDTDESNAACAAPGTMGTIVK